VRQPGAVVEAFVLAMCDTRYNGYPGASVALQFVSDHNPWRVPQALEKLTEESFGCLPVAPALHEDIERMTLLIDSAPEVMVLSPDRQHDLVEMPFIARLRLTPAQLVGISLAELQCSLPNRLVGNNDAATGHQFLDIAETQRKPEVVPHHVADDLGMIADAAVELWICHRASLQNSVAYGKLTARLELCRDNAILAQTPILGRDIS
jgi:hypothetical protein